MDLRRQSDERSRSNIFMFSLSRKLYRDVIVVCIFCCVRLSISFSLTLLLVYLHIKLVVVLGKAFVYRLMLNDITLFLFSQEHFLQIKLLQTKMATLSIQKAVSPSFSFPFLQTALSGKTLQNSFIRRSPSSGIPFKEN